MNKLWLLLKIQFQNLLLRYGAKSSNKKKATGVLLMLLPTAACLYLSVMYSFMMLDVLPEGSKHITLFVIGVLSIMLALVFGYQGASGHLFGFKDYDMLMALPVRPSYVLTSKLVSYMMLLYVYSLFLIVPCSIIVGIQLHYGISYYLMSIPMWIVFPFVPAVLSAILAYVSMVIAGKFKYKNLINNIITMVFMVGIFVLSFSIQSLMNLNVAQWSDIQNNIITYLPFIGWMIDGIVSGNILHYLMGVGLNVFILVAFIVIFSRFFMKLNGQIKGGYTVKNFKLKESKQSSRLVALFNKELRTYLANSTYMMNTIVFPIMVLVGAVYLLFIREQYMMVIIQIAPMVYIMVLGAAMFGTFTCCTTNCAISLEGKQMNLLKSLPLSANDVFMAKILLNVLINTPLTLIAALIVSYVFSFSGIQILLLILAIVGAGVLISLIGLMINLHYYRLDWDNAARIVKQSMPVFVTTFGSMIISLVFFLGGVFIASSTNSNIVAAIFVIVVLISDVVLALILNKNGERYLMNVH